MLVCFYICVLISEFVTQARCLFLLMSAGSINAFYSAPVRMHVSLLWLECFPTLSQENSPAGNQDEKQKENIPPGQDRILPCLATCRRQMGRRDRREEVT